MSETLAQRLTALLLASFVAFAASDALAISAECKNQPRPDRSAVDAFFKTFSPTYKQTECMVRLDVTFHDGVKVANTEYQLGKQIGRYLVIHEPTAAAYYFERGRDGFYYMLYVNACPQRFEITERMVSEVSKCFAGEADIKVLRDPVVPGADTLIPVNMGWTDSEPE